jgi:glucose-6-phosphate 1-dehydrogenase
MMEEERPTILVVFGITGDLSKRYLLPALTEIYKANQLPEEFEIVGISRRKITAADIFDDNTHLLRRLTNFMQMDVANGDDYKELKDFLGALAKNFQKTPQIIFYFAVPPAAVASIITNLGKARLNGQRVKLLLEKPFGFDYHSAKDLIGHIQKYYTEDQIFRIDHYLAKEVAQNISIILGSSVLFKSVWSYRYIKSIEIIAAEEIGVEGRESFYEQTGALRDVIQSHLLQLTALTVMDPYEEVFDFSKLPTRRLAALKQLKPPKGDEIDKKVFRGQYEGYQKDVNNPGSNVETFVALELTSRNPRWRGVPIYLASGKKLDQKLSQIRVTFNAKHQGRNNQLVIRVQPREAIELDLPVKQPGYERRIDIRTLSFSFEQNFDRLPDAYEQLLVDAMRGSHSLFASSEEVIESWRVLQPILDYWSTHDKSIKIYKPGSSAEDIVK